MKSSLRNEVKKMQQIFSISTFMQKLRKILKFTYNLLYLDCVETGMIHKQLMMRGGEE